MKTVLSFVFIVVFSAISFSAQKDIIVSTYPKTHSEHIGTKTSIGISASNALKLPSEISIIGSKSGAHTSTLSRSVDKKTLIISPTVAFAPSEAVEILLPSLQTTTSQLIPPVSLTFTTDAETTYIPDSFHSDDPITEASLHSNRKFTPSQSILGVPTVTISKNANPSEGDMYMANVQFFNGIEMNTNCLVYDKNGSMIFSRPVGIGYGLDFRPWKNGTFTYFDSYKEKYYVLDSTYRVLDSLKAANGYQTDGHELVLNDDGSYLLIAMQKVTMDMRQYNENGKKFATVLCNVIQEFDKDKNLIREWRSLDHYSVEDAIYLDFSAQVIDFCHANAIEIDYDGNLLFSCRHMDEITKIDRLTGDIIWRLGGLHNQFTFTNDSIQFSHQHDIRRTKAGTYTLFDNGNLHTKGGIFSRAVEYKIDEAAKTITKLWEFRHSPDVFGEAMGSVQRLPKGNTLICWGACDSVTATEVTTSGETEFEMVMNAGDCSYRAYKFAPTDLNASVTALTKKDQSLLCYPNPASEVTAIYLPHSTVNEAALELYDNLGRVVLKKSIQNLPAAEPYVNLNTTTLPNGTYHLRLIAEQGLIGSDELVVRK